MYISSCCQFAAYETAVFVDLAVGYSQKEHPHFVRQGLDAQISRNINWFQFT